MASLSDTLDAAQQADKSDEQNDSGSRPAWETLFEEDGIAYALVLAVALVAVMKHSDSSSGQPTLGAFAQGVSA